MPPFHAITPTPVMAKAIPHLTIPLSRNLGPTRYGWDLHLGNPQETLIQTSNLPIHSRHY